MANFAESLGRSQALPQATQALASEAQGIREQLRTDVGDTAAIAKLGIEKQVAESNLQTQALSRRAVEFNLKTAMENERKMNTPISFESLMSAPSITPEQKEVYKKWSDQIPQELKTVTADGKPAITPANLQIFKQVNMSALEMQKAFASDTASAKVTSTTRIYNQLQVDLANEKNDKKKAELQPKLIEAFKAKLNAEAELEGVDTEYRKLKIQEETKLKEKEFDIGKEGMKESAQYERESMKESQRTKRELSREKTLRDIAAGKKEEKGQPTAQNFNAAIGAYERTGMKRGDAERKAAEDIRTAIGAYPKNYKPKPYKVGDLFQGESRDRITEVRESSSGRQMVKLSDGTVHYADE